MKGGARKGAGRKRLPPELKKRMITVRLRPAIVEWMKAQDGSYSKQIENSLALKYNYSSQQPSGDQKEEK